MSDGPNKQPAQQERVSATGADALATRALAVVAAREPAVRPASRGLDPRLLRLLETAVLDPERAARRQAEAQMRRAGVPWEDIADQYIPAVARRLGELWCEDEMSFADVTIATARLQAMLRELGPEWSEETVFDPRAPNVMLAQRETDHHTLGAMVVAGQLRRRGVSIRLAIGLPDMAIADTVAAGHYDAVLLSASCSERLETVRDLVKKIRNAQRSAPPIVVGGTFIHGIRNVGLETGADHATSDPLEALRLCGLRIPHYISGQSGNGI